MEKYDDTKDRAARAQAVVDSRVYSTFKRVYFETLCESVDVKWAPKYRLKIPLGDLLTSHHYPILMRDTANVVHYSPAEFYVGREDANSMIVDVRCTISDPDCERAELPRFYTNPSSGFIKIGV
jgi:hypothetical protein